MAGWSVSEPGSVVPSVVQAAACPLIAGPSQPAAPPIRVLHVINGEHYSGAERVQDLLALRLGDFGFEVAFACVKPGQFAARRRSQDALLFAVPMQGRWDLRAAWDVARLVQRHGFALLHAHTPRSALVARLASRLTRRPLIYHVHSPATRDSHRRLHNWVNGRLERWMMRSATQLIAVSRSLAADLNHQGYPASRVTVVPNGVPVSACLAERSPPCGCWTLGTVALFRPRKGTEVLIDAVAHLQARGHNVQLQAIGGFESADYEESLRRRAADRGVSQRLEWTGFCTDVGSALTRLDALVLPSLYGEGLPMVVLEAMAAGVPVVASRVEGVPEAVRDGVDGLLVEPGNAAALAESLEHLIQGRCDWQALRASAWSRQRAHFSDRSMAESVAQVYREALGTSAFPG